MYGSYGKYSSMEWLMYIPGTQITLVLTGKDLVLEGPRLNIEHIQVPGIYIYTVY